MLMQMRARRRREERERERRYWRDVWPTLSPEEQERVRRRIADDTLRLFVTLASVLTILAVLALVVL